MRSQGLALSLRLLCGVCVALMVMVPAQAATTIRFYAIVAAGGSVDAMARIVGEKFGPLVDATVIVENKPGGGGNLATQTVARAAPDGLSILVSGNNHTSNLSLYKETGYKLDDLIRGSVFADDFVLVDHQFPTELTKLGTRNSLKTSIPYFQVNKVSKGTGSIHIHPFVPVLCEH